MGRCYEYIKGAHCRDDIASLTNKEIDGIKLTMIYKVVDNY